jgi:two-component system, OmpR family, phosphate regulon sensor histidine kinase PhoR
MLGGSSQNARIKRILDQDSVILIHGVLTGIFLLEVVLFSAYESITELLIILLGSALWVTVGGIRYYNALSVNKYPALYLTIYHVVFGLFFALYESAYSPYLLIWLVVGYLTHHFYGIRGLIITSGVTALVLLNQAFRSLPSDTNFGEYLRFIGVQMLIFGTISLFFSITGKLNSQDRKILAASVNKAQIERQRITSLINSMGDGVISTDEQGIIKLYNAAALNILDTNARIEEMNVSDVMNIIDKSAKVVNIISEASKRNINIVSTEYLMVYPDGEKINLYLNISPIKLSFQQNSEKGYIISFRDITHEKSLEEERNEFISVVSHELRTPIAITEANISNAQFLAEKGNNPGAIRTSLEAAHKQALFLANMINDLSTLSRAERGKLDMKTESIDPREIMKSLVEDYTKEAATKGLEFSTSIAGDVPESINSNRLYVREILQNFITNSIKYTKEGGVSVVLKGRQDGVEFSVKDTGIGISKSDQKRVFDKFFRSEDFRTRESSGTGLGLYVTKKLMRLINAEISLKSKLNEGSVFTVFIPDLTKDTNRQ